VRVRATGSTLRFPSLTLTRRARFGGARSRRGRARTQGSVRVPLIFLAFT
jgi:hypothetical protein